MPTDAKVDRLVIEKSEHRMVVYGDDGQELASYRVAVGVGGGGPKQYEGDGRTPEGRYRIDSRHRSKQFHRFLHVSYPNDEDRNRFAELRRKGEVPEGRGIGDAIGIHGTPAWALPIARRTDWTAGCIAITDAEAEELYRKVKPNALVEIVP